VWEMRDPHEGFQPVCPVHGAVEMPRLMVDAPHEQPWRHEVTFAGLGTAGTGRSRRLQLGDIPGAIRQSRPQPGPKILFVDPHAGPTRPG
jgi:hypothetical protein